MITHKRSNPMKEKIINVVVTALMTVPALASADITESLSGTIGIGAIVIDSAIISTQADQRNG
jgi:hypothetical protein